MKALFLIAFQREWLLAVRHMSTVLQPLWFVLLLVAIFPIAMGTDILLLNRMAAGIIWVAVLLSILLSAENTWTADYHDGSCLQFVLLERTLLPIIAAKCTIQYILLILPIILAMPLFVLWYQLTWIHGFMIALTVLLGSPAVLLLAMLGAVLTLPVGRVGLLIIVVILPLYVPIMIFSMSAISAEIQGFATGGQLALIGAMTLLAVTVLPFVISATIKASVNTE